MKKQIKNPVLETWAGLNAHLMQTTDEAALARLLNEETSGRARRQFIMRIHSRINKVRATRERAALTK